MAPETQTFNYRFTQLPRRAVELRWIWTLLLILVAVADTSLETDSPFTRKQAVAALLKVLDDHETGVEALYKLRAETINHVSSFSQCATDRGRGGRNGKACMSIDGTAALVHATLGWDKRFVWLLDYAQIPGDFRIGAALTLVAGMISRFGFGTADFMRANAHALLSSGIDDRIPLLCAPVTRLAAAVADLLRDTTIREGNVSILRKQGEKKYQLFLDNLPKIVASTSSWKDFWHKDLLFHDPLYWRRAALLADPLERNDGFRSSRGAASGSVALNYPFVLKYGLCPCKLLRPHSAQFSGKPILLSLVGTNLRQNVAGTRLALEVAVHVIEKGNWANWQGADLLGYTCIWEDGTFETAEVLSQFTWWAPKPLERSPPFAPLPPLQVACEVPSSFTMRFRTFGRLPKLSLGVGPKSRSRKEWPAVLSVKLCPLPPSENQLHPTFGLCTKPLYSIDPGTFLLQQWLLYHAEIGFDVIDVYDLDGSAGTAFASFQEMEGSKTSKFKYFGFFPTTMPALRNLSFIPNTLNQVAADFTFAVQQGHCLMRHRALGTKWLTTFRALDEWVAIGPHLSAGLGTHSSENPRARLVDLFGRISSNVSAVLVPHITFLGSWEHKGIGDRTPLVEQVTSRRKGKRKDASTFFSGGSFHGFCGTFVRPAKVVALIFIGARPYPEFTWLILSHQSVRLNHYQNIFHHRYTAVGDELVEDMGTSWAWPSLRKLLNSLVRPKQVCQDERGYVISEGIRKLAPIIMEEMDADSSADLDEEEFARVGIWTPVANLSGRRQNTIMYMLHAIAVWWTHGRAHLFASMDNDRSGTLSIDELSSGMRTSSNEHFARSCSES